MVIDIKMVLADFETMWCHNHNPQQTRLGQPVPYTVPVHYNPSLLSTQTRTPDTVDSLFSKINHENKIPET
jgi:hypothetical protein